MSTIRRKYRGFGQKETLPSIKVEHGEDVTESEPMTCELGGRSAVSVACSDGGTYLEFSTGKWSAYNASEEDSQQQLFSEGTRRANGNGLDIPASIRKEIPLECGPISQMENGFAHSLILTESGALFARGTGADGQTGIGSDQFTFKPVQITMPDPVLQISCGFAHSICLTAAGTVFAWGLNTSGQCGSAQPDRVRVPQVVPVVPAAQIAAGATFTMILAQSGAVYVMGDNEWGQLGLGHTDLVRRPTRLPVPPGSSGRFVSIGAGEEHAGAVDSAGNLFTWGRNDDDQLPEDYSSDEDSGWVGMCAPTLIEKFARRKSVMVHGMGEMPRTPAGMSRLRHALGPTSDLDFCESESDSSAPTPTPEQKQAKDFKFTNSSPTPSTSSVSSSRRSSVLRMDIPAGSPVGMTIVQEEGDEPSDFDDSEERTLTTDVSGAIVGNSSGSALTTATQLVPSGVSTPDQEPTEVDTETFDSESDDSESSDCDEDDGEGDDDIRVLSDVEVPPRPPRLVITPEAQPRPHKPTVAFTPHTKGPASTPEVDPALTMAPQSDIDDDTAQTVTDGESSEGESESEDLDDVGDLDALLDDDDFQLLSADETHWESVEEQPTEHGTDDGEEHEEEADAAPRTKALVSPSLVQAPDPECPARPNRGHRRRQSHLEPDGLGDGSDHSGSRASLGAKGQTSNHRLSDVPRHLTVSTRTLTTGTEASDSGHQTRSRRRGHASDASAGKRRIKTKKLDWSHVRSKVGTMSKWEIIRRRVGLMRVRIRANEAKEIKARRARLNKTAPNPAALASGKAKFRRAITKLRVLQEKKGDKDLATTFTRVFAAAILKSERTALSHRSSKDLRRQRSVQKMSTVTLPTKARIRSTPFLPADLLHDWAIKLPTDTDSMTSRTADNALRAAKRARALAVLSQMPPNQKSELRAMRAPADCVKAAVAAFMMLVGKSTAVSKDWAASSAALKDATILATRSLRPNSQFRVSAIKRIAAALEGADPGDMMRKSLAAWILYYVVTTFVGDELANHGHAPTELHKALVKQVDTDERVPNSVWQLVKEMARQDKRDKLQSSRTALGPIRRDHSLRKVGTVGSLGQFRGKALEPSSSGGVGPKHEPHGGRRPKPRPPVSGAPSGHVRSLEYIKQSQTNAMARARTLPQLNKTPSNVSRKALAAYSSVHPGRRPVGNKGADQQAASARLARSGTLSSSSTLNTSNRTGQPMARPSSLATGRKAAVMDRSRRLPPAIDAQ
ncbi:Regulator of chromosome condensation (RCC1) repeat [Carpediemonas membranifera]|uniref:Regulator of chromosome condensation (RCC1) repeat n=1 Tax=Carpediemonas membranifera TaxID=201153 RepID=A0A8J6BV77_9EUKA|nr:Regulator of chromosome condensation (RCC1) repeat [Carpediemonas membranifera]|eukprot:KAG9391146.1 Regulator of chromosome condensation (RCC1) repeat [Carpediemonas membranifera]